MARTGKMNIKGMEQFMHQVQELENEADVFIQSCAKELAARLLAKAVDRTPTGVYPASTGKMGGTLKRGWTVGEIEKVGNEYKIEIVNPVEYASYVEFGHRTANHQGWVNGRFMLTISEQEIQTAAPKILERKLEKYLKEKLK